MKYDPSSISKAIIFQEIYPVCAVGVQNLLSKNGGNLDKVIWNLCNGQGVGEASSSEQIVWNQIWRQMAKSNEVRFGVRCILLRLKSRILTSPKCESSRVMGVRGLWFRSGALWHLRSIVQTTISSFCSTRTAFWLAYEQNHYDAHVNVRRLISCSLCLVLMSHTTLSWGWAYSLVCSTTQKEANLSR